MADSWEQTILNDEDSYGNAKLENRDSSFLYVAMGIAPDNEPPGVVPEFPLIEFRCPMEWEQIKFSLEE